MVYAFFFSSKCSLFHNSNVFGSFVIHILYTWYILSVFFPLQNAVCFIILTYLVPVFFTFYINDIYPPFFSLQNAVGFIILTYLFPVLFTFYIQGVLKLK